MKKFWLTLILCLTCAFCAIGFAACGNNTETGGNTPTESTGGNTPTESTGGNETKAELVSAEGFIMEGSGGKITVSKDTETFSFLNKITVSDNATWVISRDEYGGNTFATKSAPIRYGDNTFYLIVTSGDGKTVNVYPMTVHRISVFTVRFNTNGDYYYYDDSIAPQSIEEGYCAAEPTVIPVKLGCTFKGWDFDFTTPITNYTTINAIWEVNPEMANFEFTSTATDCDISNVKDKTVTEIIVPDYVTGIGYAAFYDCRGLTSVTIGNSVTSIGYSAFNGCSSLTSVTIPDSVTSIGQSAFSGCNGLTSVTIGNSVTSIGDRAFDNCSKLKSIYYTGTASEWAQIDGLSGLMSSSITLYINNEPVTNVVLENITEIKPYAFSGCSGLTSVTIGNSVTSIESGAFKNCSSLTSVTIPDSVTSIGDYAFAACSGLTSINVSEQNKNYKSIDSNLYSKDGTTLIQYAIGKTATEFTIPDSVTSIGGAAFSACTGLTSVTIGNGVKSIGNSAFYGCSSLNDITFNGTKAQWLAINKGVSWKDSVPATVVHCSDGDLDI